MPPLHPLYPNNAGSWTPQLCPTRSLWCKRGAPQSLPPQIIAPGAPHMPHKPTLRSRHIECVGIFFVVVRGCPRNPPNLKMDCVGDCCPPAPCNPTAALTHARPFPGAGRQRGVQRTVRGPRAPGLRRLCAFSLPPVDAHMSTRAFLKADPHPSGGRGPAQQPPGSQPAAFFHSPSTAPQISTCRHDFQRDRGGVVSQQPVLSQQGVR